MRSDRVRYRGQCHLKCFPQVFEPRELRKSTPVSLLRHFTDRSLSFSTSCNWLFNFIIGLITPPLVENTGFGAYVFFAVFCLLSLIWVYFFVPETAGKTLEEMDRVFDDDSAAGEEARRERIEMAIAARMVGH